ncbi:MAG: 50S ribosomal protein L10 [Candidatus Cloacimonetes bacterium]|nr:50S ribosomal protein L10 [Candidatus Cloacimonadota bacterium]
MVQEIKKVTVKNLKERLSGAKAIILVDYKGINIEQVNQLRNAFRSDKIDYFVQKNTLIKRALNDEEIGIDQLDDYLMGPTAVAVCKIDEVSPARVLIKFIKEVMEGGTFPCFKAGFIGGRVFTAEELQILALLPSREELLAKVLGSAQAPIRNFLGVTQGIIRKFVYAVDAIVQKKTNAS